MKKFYEANAKLAYSKLVENNKHKMKLGLEK
jgi:hypothetical protein